MSLRPVYVFGPDKIVEECKIEDMQIERKISYDETVLPLDTVVLLFRKKNETRHVCVVILIDQKTFAKQCHS